MKEKGNIDLAVLGAVPIEVEPFFDLLDDSRDIHFRGSSFRKGRYANTSVLVGTTGLGKVNAAMMTAALAERFGLVSVWNVGCAGAYAEGPMSVGDVLVSTDVYCGDEGVITEKDVMSAEEIGIPIVVREGRSHYDHFSLVEESAFRNIQERMPSGPYRLIASAPRLAERMRYKMSLGETIDVDGAGPLDPGTPVPRFDRSAPSMKSSRDDNEFFLVYGPSLTVGMVSGDARVAQARYRRYAAFAENMEGSAVVQTCYRFGISVLECRGISNIAGDRSKDHWQVERAVANSCGILMTYLETLRSG
jgi:futalosine hydrolase